MISRPTGPAWPSHPVVTGGAAALVLALSVCGSVPAVAAQAPGVATPAASALGRPTLDLGPSNLTETRTTRTLAAGVTLTSITRGATDPALSWTLEVLIGADSGNPDPDAPATSLSDQPAARAVADRLRSEGFVPRVERVAQPRAVDVPSGTLGYRVRVGSWPTQAAADAVKADLVAAGELASSVYTGWDGAASDRGPWHVNVVTVDPRTFRGRLGASYGPDLFDRETTSALSRAAGAVVGTNGGFFVLDPASGAPGDPAGVGVYGGRLVSEPTAGRPALVLHADASDTAVRRLWWSGTAAVGSRLVPLDGIDRVPGLIRNCGGDRTDSPTSLPLHDVTCVDAAEIVAETPAYGSMTPTGPGLEVVLGSGGKVVAVHTSRGSALAAGQTSLQATGVRVDELRRLRVGDRVALDTHLVDASGRTVRTGPDETVVNGAPQLVRDGRVEVTQAADGMVHPEDPSFAYGFVVKRNPRTLAGRDAQGRTVIVTVDGRTTSDLGLSIPEAADVARSLGLVDAINLDGGGSTAMAVDGSLISHPSDATGERPVGDALVVTARR